MFHRRFPDTTVSVTTLRKAYKEGGVRYKFIKRTKKAIDFSNQYYRDLFDEMYRLLQEAEESNSKIIYLDEAIFSFNTFNTKAWSSAHK